MSYPTKMLSSDKHIAGYNPFRKLFWRLELNSYPEFIVHSPTAIGLVRPSDSPVDAISLACLQMEVVNMGA